MNWRCLKKSVKDSDPGGTARRAQEPQAFSAKAWTLGRGSRRSIQGEVLLEWEKRPPAVVDTEGTPITDEEIPLYSGSRVKLAFYQQPYVLKDGETYGSSLKLLALQVVSLNNAAGVDTGDMSAEAAADIFGKTEGFKAPDPSVTPNMKDDDDF